MTTGPEDQRAAARRGQLRASQADREDVIEALKAAYVVGRLTEDEFEARVGQAFAARTHGGPGRDHRGHPGRPGRGPACPDAGPGGRLGHRRNHRGRHPRRRGAHRRFRMDPLGDHHDRGVALHRERAALRAAGTTIPHAAAAAVSAGRTGPRRRASPADRPRTARYALRSYLDVKGRAPEPGVGCGLAGRAIAASDRQPPEYRSFPCCCYLRHPFFVLPFAVETLRRRHGQP